ncbi:MAG: dTDP-glucose 4,6-dehydratase [Chlamydiae bacterium]|nr:dTDP-glucose 4,6-dehydratase [Chlamydiota bacterium]
MEKKKVLVIGSNSFSGIDFIDLLLEKGEYQVIGISRSKEKPDFFLTYKRHQCNNYSFHQIDLNNDLDQLANLIADQRPDYVVNFAALVEVGPSWDNPEDWFTTNAVAVTKLAKLLTQFTFIKKYVHISTPEVYGSCEDKITEDAPLNPSTPYAASKAAGDLSLFTFFKNYNLPMCMVRSTNVYGRGQSLFKIVPRVALYLKMGKKIPLHGGGKAVKSYIHIRDISEGQLSIMLDGKPGEIYHLSPNGAGIAICDLIEIICNKMKVKFDDAVDIVGERLGQDKAYVIDSSKAREAFDWQPRVPLEQGVSDVIDWVNENYNEMSEQPLEYNHKL